jgi:hypothetical protein
VLEQRNPLSIKDATVIASRALTLYFLAWVVADLCYLPTDVSSVLYFTKLAAHSGQYYDLFLRAEHIRLLCIHVIRIALALLAAGWAYRCGPGAVRFLFPTSEQTTDKT